MRKAAVVVALALAVAACKDKGKSEAAVEEGEELSKNPFRAMQQVGEAAQKMAEKQQELAAKKPVEPVKFDALIGYLPEMEGWKASEPEGQTNQMGEWKMTVVSRDYEKGEGEATSRVEVQILDGAYIPMAYAGFQMMSQFSQESTEGYTKGVKIDGNPGVETWKKKERDAELHVLIADRFLVQIKGDNLDKPEALRDWLRRVDVQKIAAIQ